MALRCVYTDLDGTLLGKDASLFRDADGGFTLLPARALEACYRAGVEVVIKSGRRKVSVMEDARLIGQTSYIYEIGCGLVIDGEETLLTGDFVPHDGKTVHDLIAESGAPALLLERYAGRLEPHSPWHLGREASHLMRGRLDPGEANALLTSEGFDSLRLVDNGVVDDGVSGLHAYHLIPHTASKAGAVRRHIQARGYLPDECIAVGDSHEDLGVAGAVRRFFLVANALERDESLAAALSGHSNVDVTEGRNGDGFYEAVVRSLVG